MLPIPLFPAFLSLYCDHCSKEASSLSLLVCVTLAKITFKVGWMLAEIKIGGKRGLSLYSILSCLVHNASKYKEWMRFFFNWPFKHPVRRWKLSFWLSFKTMFTDKHGLCITLWAFYFFWHRIKVTEHVFVSIRLFGQELICSGIQTWWITKASRIVTEDDVSFVVQKKRWQYEVVWKKVYKSQKELFILVNKYIHTSFTVDNHIFFFQSYKNNTSSSFLILKRTQKQSLSISYYKILRG